MPKQIVELVLRRSSPSESWGFTIIGGKDQSLTVKVSKVRPGGIAERAGVKVHDFVWRINDKEVFNMTHDQCVNEIRRATHQLSLAAERGDHIVPSFEEIWGNKRVVEQREARDREREKNFEYYQQAMLSPPKLSGYMPRPHNFTTVGKPQIYNNQYDSPIEVYSKETLEELMSQQWPGKSKPPNQPLQPQQHQAHGVGVESHGANFDATKSNVIGLIQQQQHYQPNF